jgi:hypothetical protein
MIEVGADQIGMRDMRGLAVPGAPRGVGQNRLDFPLDALGELLALPEKTLMPLSSNGLCDAEMTTPACSRRPASDDDRRRRARALVAALRPAPCAARRGPRLARIAADQEFERRAARRRRGWGMARQRRAQPADRRRVERIAAAVPRTPSVPNSLGISLFATGNPHLHRPGSTR